MNDVILLLGPTGAGKTRELRRMLQEERDKDGERWVFDNLDKPPLVDVLRLPALRNAPTDVPVSLFIDEVSIQHPRDLQILRWFLTTIRMRPVGVIALAAQARGGMDREILDYVNVLRFVWPRGTQDVHLPSLSGDDPPWSTMAQAKQELRDMILRGPNPT